MADTSVSIAQAACLMMRIEPITSFSDNSSEAKALNANYADLVENELSLYPWRFASKQVQLNLIADEVVGGEWDAAYQVPAGIIGVQAITINGTNIEYDRYYDQVHCNANEDDEVILDGTFKAEESKWPPYFTRLIEYRLAELLASGIALRPDLAGYFEKKGEVQMKLSRHRDSTSQTTKAIRSSRFRTARRNSRSF